jgi:hypothetical protein
LRGADGGRWRIVSGGTIGAALISLQAVRILNLNEVTAEFAEHAESVMVSAISASSAVMT